MRVIVTAVTSAEVCFAPLDPGESYVRLPVDAVLDPGESYVRRPVDAVPTRSVGEVGDLDVVADGADILAEFAPANGLAAVRVRLASRGPASASGFSYRSGGRSMPLDLPGHGVDPIDRDAAANLGFWLVTDAEGRPTAPLSGRFDVDDVAAWTAGRDAARRNQADQAWVRNNVVNPYTFVGLPDDAMIPGRDEPPGHDALHGGWSGTLRAVLHARTPLLVRNIEDDRPGFPRRPESDHPDGRLFIPGSSLHGALRSLHETLSGSCLRVFDDGFVPAYRSAAIGDGRPWTLGVVAKVDTAGRPIGIDLCDEVRWVLVHELSAARHLAGRDQPVSTGDRFVLDPAGSVTESRSRWVYTGAVQSLPEGDTDGDGDAWIALVTNPSVRDKSHPYYCALGRRRAAPQVVALSDAAWTTYGRAVDGARIHTGTETEPEHQTELDAVARHGLRAVSETGTWLHVAGGGGSGQRVPLRWHKPRRWLFEGQVVWVLRPDGQAETSDAIKLSVIWRTVPAAHSAGERVPKALLPCSDPDHLCPSCRLFGSADVRPGADRRRAEQRSYRGHVRVADAVLLTGETERATLPRQGGPRPGAGQFYLAHDSTVRADEGSSGNHPGWWGGFPDATTPRRLRGRKFYWHTDPARDAQRQRHDAHDHAKSEPTESELVSAGATFAVTIRFDGLDRIALGGLVATLQPARLLATRLPQIATTAERDPTGPRFAIHVGGGKPLGLGSCTLTMTEDDVQADTAQTRYQGASREAVDLDACVEAFAAAYPRLEGTWTQLAAALHVEHVDSRVVSYPVVGRWRQDGACPGEEQHEHFRWFGAMSGLRLAGGAKPYGVLPPVTDPTSALEIPAAQTHAAAAPAGTAGQGGA